MLKKQLDEARKHRAQVSEYNIIANKILAYPSREEMMKYVICINKSAPVSYTHLTLPTIYSV